MTMGFISSVLDPAVNAQSMELSDLLSKDSKSDNNYSENANLKELFDSIPGLNPKDKSRDADASSSQASSDGNKGTGSDELNQGPIFKGKDNTESKSANDEDYVVYSDDILEDTHTSSGSEDTKEQNQEKEEMYAVPEKTPQNILSSILDKLPYTDALSDSLSPSSSSSSPSSSSE